MGDSNSSNQMPGVLGVFELSPVPAWIHDRDSLAFLEVNAAAQRAFGYSLEEFRSKTIADLRTEPDRQRLLAMLDLETEGDRQRGAWELLHKDGTSGLYDLTATDLAHDGRPAVFVVVYPVESRIAHMATLAAQDEAVASQLVAASAQITRELGYARAVLGGIPDGIIAMDGKNNVTLLNPAGAAMLGWNEDDAVGRPVREVVAALADMAPTLVHEDLFRRKDGSQLPVALAVAPLSDVERGGLVVTFRNLSRERDERLRHRITERLYRQIVEGASDFIYVLSTDGVVLEANPAVQQILGYTQDEIRGMTAEQILAPDSLQHSRNQLDTKLEGAELTRYNIQMVHKSGRLVWVEISSRLVERNDGTVVIHGIGRDITDRIRAEERSQREQANLRAMMETINSAVWVFDGQNRIIYANEELVRLLGFPREDILTPGFFRSRMRRGDVAKSREVFEAWSSEESTRGSFEATVLNSANEWRTLEVAIGRVEYDGRLMYLASAFDVTDARRLQDQYRQLAHRLVEAQERERAQLARELHDEFGQDLTALTLMLGGDSLDEESHAEVMAIIKKLIAATRSMALDLRPSALDHLGLQVASNSLVERFARRTGIYVEFSSELPPGARFDREVELAAYRILQEALTNVARHSGSRSASCRIALDGNFLTLTVRDFGQGFDTKSGTVLEGKAGIMGIRERAAAVSGDMRLTSEPGAGTVVTVHLPARPKTESNV